MSFKALDWQKVVIPFRKPKKKRPTRMQGVDSIILMALNTAPSASEPTRVRYRPSLVPMVPPTTEPMASPMMPTVTTQVCVFMRSSFWAFQPSFWLST